MLKAIIQLDNKNVFLMGLTETNLNRLQFNKEIISFDFQFVKRPDLRGEIRYVNWAENQEQIEKEYIRLREEIQNYKQIKNHTIFFNISISMMEEMRKKMFNMVELRKKILDEDDRQLFYCGGIDTENMKNYLRNVWIHKEKKRLKIS